jgi:hypothetical protein
MLEQLIDRLFAQSTVFVSTNILGHVVWHFPTPELPRSSAHSILPSGGTQVLVFDKKSRRDSSASLSFGMSRRLDRFDILRPWSLWPTSFRVGHLLSLVESVEAHPFEVRIVEEHVLAVPRVNESKTFVRELLDRTFCHLRIQFLKSVIAALPDTTGSGCLTAWVNSNEMCEKYK